MHRVCTRIASSLHRCACCACGNRAAACHPHLTSHALTWVCSVSKLEHLRRHVHGDLFLDASVVRAAGCHCVGYCSNAVVSTTVWGPFYSHGCASCRIAGADAARRSMACVRCSFLRCCVLLPWLKPWLRPQPSRIKPSTQCGVAHAHDVLKKSVCRRSRCAGIVPRLHMRLAV